MDSELVSVIITTYNRSHFLKETLLSIANQTYTNIEILVVDDGSKNDESLANKHICDTISRCTYYYKPNSGQPDSRNYGIKKAKGTYVGFCDDDDLWIKEKLEQQIRFFQSHPKAYIVTGDIEYIEENGTRTGTIKSHKGYDSGYVFQSYLVKNRTASIVPLLKREVFDKVGYFDPSFTIAEDWEFWRRVSYYFDFYAINDVQAYVRLHNSNITNTRTNTPFERFLMYRKLTKVIMKWGKDKFDKSEALLVEKEEYNFYHKLLYNNYNGYTKKIKFFLKIMLHSFKNFYHLGYLFIKFNIIESSNFEMKPRRVNY